MKKFILYQITFFILSQSFKVEAQIAYLDAINSNNKNALEMIISPDNKFAYVLATNEIQTYKRNPENGQLNLVASISKMQDGKQLYNVVTLKMSHDAKNIYAIGTYSAFVFSRDSSGLITPIQKLADNFLPSTYPTTNNNIEVSKDGRNIYITGGKNLFIYDRDSVTGTLSLRDTMKNLNDISGLSFDISIKLSTDNQFAYITGGHSISVFSRDTVTGLLTFKNIISGNNNFNHGLTYACQSICSSDDKFIYTVTSANGAGSLVVLSRDEASDSLSVIQSHFNYIRPQYINISPDNSIICISSGGNSIGHGSLMFFERDSITGKVRYISTYKDSYKYNTKKSIDWGSRYIYTCPSFIDSVYIHRFELFLHSSANICVGDYAKLKPTGNFASYIWSNGSTGSSITVNTPGKYFLSVTDSFGNTYSDSIAVIVRQPVISLGQDTTLFLGQSILLSPKANFAVYEWNVDNKGSPNLILKNDSSFIGTKMFTLRVKDSFGCTASDTVLVTFSSKTALSIITPIRKIKVSIYPNPFNKQTAISSETNLKNATITLSNCLGQNVKQLNNISGKNIILNRDNLPCGIYFISLAQENQVMATEKIIITD